MKTRKTHRLLRMAAIAFFHLCPLLAFAAPGDLDASFGSGGKVLTDLGRSDVANGMTLQSDGKILIAGASGSGGNDFALARYNTDGSLDTNFGSSGKVITGFGGYDVAASLVVQSDGKIVLVGASSALNGPTDFALARYTSNGSLDTGFGSGGKVTTDLGGSDSATGVALQNDGKIIVVGAANSGADFALARYNADGSLDTGFGSNGKVISDLGGSDSATSVALQSDGKVLVAGTSGNDFALVRYNSDGSLDTSFGSGGKVILDLGGSESATGLAVQMDGKIVVTGASSLTAGSSDFALVRCNGDGSLDAGFGNNGKVFTDFGGNDSGISMALQGDGRIVVAGASGSGGNDFALARYNTDGSLDVTFGSGGKVLTGFGGSDSAAALTLQGDGKIVLAGVSNALDGSSDFALARYKGASVSFAGPLQVYADYSVSAQQTTTLTFVNSGTSTLTGLVLSGSGYQGTALGLSGTMALPDLVPGAVRTQTFGASGGVFSSDFRHNAGGNAAYAVTGSQNGAPFSETFSPHENATDSFAGFLGSGADGLPKDGPVNLALVAGTLVSGAAPFVGTLASTGTTNSSVTLTGVVVPNASAASVRFEYGTSTAYGNSTAAQTVNGVALFSGLPGGLNAGTTYHYRAVAINTSGTSYGTDATFTTLNTAPHAQDDVFYFPAKPATAQTLNVLANDSDVDLGDAKHITSVSHAAGGTLTLVSGSTAILYTPTSRYAGSDSFTYTISDAHGATATATVRIRNPYLGFVGTFQALIATGDSARDGFATVTLTKTQAFTLSLKNGSGSYSAKGTMDATGHGTATIVRKGLPDLIIGLNLDFNGGGFSISVTDTTGSPAVTANFAVKALYPSANPAPQSGKFTILIPPPQLSLYQATATAAVSSGKINTIALMSGGYGYVTTPNVRIISPTGSGATATAVVSGGQVTVINVTKKGSGYPASGVTVVIDPPSGIPQGTGYATMSVADTGAINIAGKLGDGTAFTAGSWLDASLTYQNGSYSFNPYAVTGQRFPLYASVYSTPTGQIYGTLEFRDVTDVSDFDGTLHWSKPPQTTAQIFKTGFNVTLNAIGSHYTAPAKGDCVLDVPETPRNVDVEFFDGNLPAPIRNTLTLTRSNTLGDINPALLKMKTTPGTGLVSGVFATAAGGVSRSFGGVIFQKQNIGGGAFIGVSQSGSMALGEAHTPVVLSGTTQYSLESSFSIANGNPNGVWSYGYSATPTSVLSLLPATGMAGSLEEWVFSSGDVTKIVHNPTSSAAPFLLRPRAALPAHSVALLGGGANASLCARIEWTAPDAGFYSLNGSFVGIYTADVHVTVNGIEILAAKVKPRATRALATPAFALSAGDHISFSVIRSAPAILNAMITKQP